MPRNRRVGKSQFNELKAAGLDEFAMKFEMSDRETFNRLNPSTNFDRRMERISFILEAGISLASGNIVDYPGQTRDSLANDIMLMKELSISWAPIISYLPAKDTPLAKERSEILNSSTKNIDSQDNDADGQYYRPATRQGFKRPVGYRRQPRCGKFGANMLFVDLSPIRWLKISASLTTVPLLDFHI